MSARTTREWASAMVFGWVDLSELSMLDHSDRPDCGLRRCGERARWVDPSGVGWCSRHAGEGAHGPPPARRP